MQVKDTGSQFEAVAPGTYVARCVSLVGIGTHEREWQGTKRLSSEIMVTWELPFETMEDGRPYTISAFYTRSLADKANLRHALKNWRGRDFTPDELRGFELKNVLDHGCQVVCTMNDKGKVRVTSVAGLPKGMELPARVNDLKYFDPEEWDRDAYESLSDGVKKIINDSFEYSEYVSTGSILDANERMLEWKSKQGKPQYAPSHTGNGVAPAMQQAVNAFDDEVPF